LQSVSKKLNYVTLRYVTMSKSKSNSKVNRAEEEIQRVIRGLAKETIRDRKILASVTENVFVNTRQIRRQIEESVRKLHELGQRKQRVTYKLDSVLMDVKQDQEDVEDAMRFLNDESGKSSAFSSPGEYNDRFSDASFRIPRDFIEKYNLGPVLRQLEKQKQQSERQVQQMYFQGYSYGGEDNTNRVEDSIRDMRNRTDDMLVQQLRMRLGPIHDVLGKKVQELEKIVAGLKDTTGETYAKVTSLIAKIRTIFPHNVMNETRKELRGLEQQLQMRMGSLRKFHNQIKMMRQYGNSYMMSF